eukprot:CAMPEP_0114697830 /NCGR_PEP_ID=MMETSP0191-20121206/74208_1 /TAXON_ID=126664 /ORGANISM="Sorites sp." /LENGTH=108 /DNA_ID=CAMNT_0001997381 /DNA_START=127 /DNA_END=453 /DNA_ORIENTATION=+
MSRTVDYEPFAKTDVQKAEPGFTFEFSSRRSGIFSTPRVSAKWHLQSGNSGNTDAGSSEEDADHDFSRRARWFVERYSVYAAPTIAPWGRATSPMAFAASEPRILGRV